MGLEDLPWVSPVGVSGSYVLIGVAPISAVVKPDPELFESGNPSFARISPDPLAFEYLKEQFLFEFYESLGINVRDFIETAAKCDNLALRKEALDSCQRAMARVEYNAHILSWGDITWHGNATEKPKIEITRYEHEANKANPHLRIMDIPFKRIFPECGITYHVLGHRHQMIRQDSKRIDF